MCLLPFSYYDSYNVDDISDNHKYSMKKHNIKQYRLN